MSTIPTLTNNEPAVAPHFTSTRAESASRRYFAIAGVLCFLVYLFPFFALRSGIKPQWWITFWSGVVNISYSHERQDADVLIFGDSTASINIDPVRMTADLGMKVFVLPNTSTSLPVTGYDTLEKYLLINKQPRLIVFYLSPWDLDFLYHPFTPIVQEGVEMLLLHGSRTEIFHYASHHPEKILMFPFHFYAGTNVIGDVLYFRSHNIASVEQGHILNLPHSLPMKPDCVFNPKLLPNGSKDTSAREAVDRFAKPGTRTMVFVPPLPNCEGIDAILNAQHRDLETFPLQVLPPENFKEDGWQAHMLPGKIGPSTDYLEQAIRQKLGVAPSGTQR